MSCNENTILFYQETLALPSLDELLEQSVRLRGATSWATGEIYRWHAPDGRDFLVKSFARSGWISRHFFGYPTMKNEWRMLTMLRNRGLDAAPMPFAKIGRGTILMKFVRGTELESAKHYHRENIAPPSEEFYRELKTVLHKIHADGIAHGDIRRANVLVAEDGHPRIIDWSTGVDSSSCIRKILFRQFQRSDEYSLCKILRDSAPQLLTPEDEAMATPGIILRLGRRLRQKLYRDIWKRVCRR